MVEKDASYPRGLLALPSVLVLHLCPQGPHIAEDLWGQAEVRVELLEVFLGPRDVVRAQRPRHEADGPLQLLLLDLVRHVEGLCDVLDPSWYAGLPGSDVDACSGNPSN